MNIIQKFRNNMDCYADTWHSERGFMEEGDVIPAMTEERFVKVVNEILSECQKTIEPDKDDEQALHIALVSQQSELLNAFLAYISDPLNRPANILDMTDKEIETFLKAFNCG